MVRLMRSHSACTESATSESARTESARTESARIKSSESEPAPTPRTRAGVTLIELMVSMMLLLVVVAIGAIAARRTLSIQARVALQDGRASGISDALRTLARHAVDADPRLNDIRAARDTAIDIIHPIGVMTVCRARGDTVLSTAVDDSLPWSTVLPRAITTDDQLRFWNDARQEWIQRGVRNIASATGTCGDSTSLFPGRAWQRIILTDTTGNVRAGTVVRVMQRERWSLVRGGDGAWALSMATWDATRNAFDTPQPLIAPLASPNAAGGAGFGIRAIDARGAIVADSALTTTRSLIAVLRAPRHALYGALSDSVRINVGAH
jgi:prepilin-type N-terminal cleavage/methylation domain-containing protein